MSNLYSIFKKKDKSHEFYDENNETSNLLKKNRELVNLLKDNHESLQQFHAVEVKILSIFNYKDFFTEFINEIKKNFNEISFVWISIVDNVTDDTGIRKFVQSLSESELLKYHIKIVDADYFYKLTNNDVEPILSNEKMSKFHDLCLESFKHKVTSIAVSPITVNGETIGSINYGYDYDAPSDKQYNQKMDNNPVKYLAVKVSICLSNVTVHEKLKFLAYHDPLTGLLNRRVMEQVLTRELSRSKRYKKNLSVVFIDLNSFKIVNDTHGHDHGDKLLIHIAETLLHLSRDLDIVSRFAGDEFVLILPETVMVKADLLMKRIQYYLTQTPLKADNLITYGSISFGIACTDGNDKSVSTSSILKEADQKLYESKKKHHCKH